MFPGQFILARRSQAPSSACPLNEGGNNQKRAKAALLRKLPYLSWLISNSFCKDVGWAVRAGGKRPLKKGSKSYCRNKKLLPKGRERELFAHNEGSTPRLHKPEACPGQEMDSYTAGRRRVWGLEEKIHPRAFLRSVVKQGRAASGQRC